MFVLLGWEDSAYENDDCEIMRRRAAALVRGATRNIWDRPFGAWEAVRRDAGHLGLWDGARLPLAGWWLLKAFDRIVVDDLRLALNDGFDACNCCAVSLLVGSTPRQARTDGTKLLLHIIVRVGGLQTQVSVLRIIERCRRRRRQYSFGRLCCSRRSLPIRCCGCRCHRWSRR